VAKLTFVFGLLDHLSNHGLHDSNIAIESTSNEASEQRNPVAFGKTEDQTRNGNATESNENNGLSAIPVRESTPTHGSEGLSYGVGRDQETSVERSIGFVAVVEILDHGVCVGQDGVEGYGLGEAAYCWIGRRSVCWLVSEVRKCTNREL
jgi:hypothetical protein